MLNPISRKYIIWLAVLALSACASGNRYLIRPGEGVGEVKLKKTRIGSVEKDFGGELSFRSWSRESKTCLIGEERTYFYHEAALNTDSLNGISFYHYCSEKSHYEKERKYFKVNKIVITSADFKTKTGNGVNSDISDFLNELGTPYYSDTLEMEVLVVDENGDSLFVDKPYGIFYKWEHHFIQIETVFMDDMSWEKVSKIEMEIDDVKF